MKVTKGLVEQHIHGAFGIDFMNCNVDEILYCSDMLALCGVSAYFPTLMTDDISVIKERISLVKEAKAKEKQKAAQIIGVHLEGPFINPNKAGVHEKRYILPLDIELYKKIDDDIIKIITIAPELDETGNFVKYLMEKDVKISAGHTQTSVLKNVGQITHLYNAMSAFHHRNLSTVTAALCDENIYIEIIADSLHVSDEVLKITFKQKSIDKILLISDALPLAHSDLKEAIFAGRKIHDEDCRLLSEDGTIAGSSLLLCDIIKNLCDKNIITFENAIKCSSTNQNNYHNIPNNLNVFWDDTNMIKKIEFNN